METGVISQVLYIKLGGGLAILDAATSVKSICRMKNIKSEISPKADAKNRLQVCVKGQAIEVKDVVENVLQMIGYRNVEIRVSRIGSVSEIIKKCRFGSKVPDMKRCKNVVEQVSSIQTLIPELAQTSKLTSYFRTKYIEQSPTCMNIQLMYSNESEHMSAIKYCSTSILHIFNPNTFTSELLHNSHVGISSCLKPWSVEFVLGYYHFARVYSFEKIDNDDMLRELYKTMYYFECHDLIEDLQQVSKFKYNEVKKLENEANRFEKPRSYLFHCDNHELPAFVKHETKKIDTK